MTQALPASQGITCDKVQENPSAESPLGVCFVFTFDWLGSHQFGAPGVFGVHIILCNYY